VSEKSTSYVDGVPVVDFDQTFPVMVDHDGGGRDSSGVPGDVGPQVNSALRDLLGWRPRVEDPKAFVDALTASFRLTMVQGHVEVQFVPRGYAVQADLGVVSGGQASLYRRAVVLRTEMLRILDGLTPLRTDADVQDVEAYRTMVRSAITQVVDELGTAGGPRVEVVDTYFSTLTGAVAPTPCATPDTVAGQAGALRDRMGLVDVNVNNPEEEGIRTSFWTLVDMLVDLQSAWRAQRVHFSGGVGQGFIGTELILISRLMEATADQVDELESLLDSVLVSKAERRTLVINRKTQLTLDGLLLWMRKFLTEDGRRIAEDTGRDGIVAALAPTLTELHKAFKKFAQWLKYTPTQTASNGSRKTPPPGLQAARVRIAVESTSRLLQELVNTAKRIGRYPAVVLTNVLISKVDRRDPIVEVAVRGFNLRPTFIPAFTKGCYTPGTSVEDLDPKKVIYPLTDSTTADEDTLVGFFNILHFVEVFPSLPEPVQQRVMEFADSSAAGQSSGSWSLNLPAEDLPIVIVDGELGKVIYAPEPLTWPALREADKPLVWTKDPTQRWNDIEGNDQFSNVPTCPIKVPNPTPYDDDDNDGPAPGRPPGGADDHVDQIPPGGEDPRLMRAGPAFENLVRVMARAHVEAPAQNLQRGVPRVDAEQGGEDAEQGQVAKEAPKRQRVAKKAVKKAAVKKAGPKPVGAGNR
jgi:hypothetical protein